MKSLNEKFPKWLGFSSSPKMKMESNSISPCSNNDFHNYLNSVGGEYNINSSNNIHNNNSGGFFHSPLAVMPLKSDGSLCFLEALTRSQLSQVTSVPRLENFFGNGQESESLLFNNNTINNRKQFEAYLSSMPCHEFSQESLLFNNNNNNDDDDNVRIGEINQSLTLSMSPGSQSSAVAANNGSECVMQNNKKRGFAKVGHNKQTTLHRKSVDTFGQRTSQYRGVTKHRWTGRYEAHLWDNSWKIEGQTRKGRQVYLGGYDIEEKAARAYDLAALKYWGLQTHTNFLMENYKDEIEEMKKMTRQEYVAHLRRKSSGFSRGASIYRGVTRHHQHGRWQARIGRVAGNKDLYLGTFNTQEEAGEAYDVAAIKFRGPTAVTNFNINRYDVGKIMASNTLLAGEQAKRNHVVETIQGPPSVVENAGDESDWKMMLYHGSQGDQQPPNSCIDHGDCVANPSFSLALQDLVGNVAHDSSKLCSDHLSNRSSLMSSLK